MTDSTSRNNVDDLYTPPPKGEKDKTLTQLLAGNPQQKSGSPKPQTSTLKIAPSDPDQRIGDGPTDWT